VKGKNEGHPISSLSPAGRPPKALTTYEIPARLTRRRGWISSKAGTSRSWEGWGHTSIPNGSARPDRRYGISQFLQAAVTTCPAVRESEKCFSSEGKERTSQWSYVDFDGDGKLDSSLALTTGAITAGTTRMMRPVSGPRDSARSCLPLKEHGNQRAAGLFGPVQLEADGKPIDVYGASQSSPIYGTWELDLICGEFLDGLIFQTTQVLRGTEICAGSVFPMRAIADDAAGDDRRDRLRLEQRRQDGFNRVAGSGRVALLENTGKLSMACRNSNRRASSPRKRIATHRRSRSPVAFDWDGDGKSIFSRETRGGEIVFIKNLGGNPPLGRAGSSRSGGRNDRIMAASNGRFRARRRPNGVTLISASAIGGRIARHPGQLELGQNRLVQKYWHEDRSEAGARTAD